jgi:hypothetical protein
MIMAKQADLSGLKALCEALGVERVDEVHRVVVDIRAGHIPMLYVERYGDANKIVAALSEPGIELRREESVREGAPIPRPHQGKSAAPAVHGNVTQNGR